MDNNSQQTTEPQITPEPMQQSELIQPIPETPSTTPFEPQKPVKKSKKNLILIVIILILLSGGLAVAILVLPNLFINTNKKVVVNNNNTTVSAESQKKVANGKATITSESKTTTLSKSGIDLPIRVVSVSGLEMQAPSYYIDREIAMQYYDAGSYYAGINFYDDNLMGLVNKDNQAILDNFVAGNAITLSYIRVYKMFRLDIETQEQKTINGFDAIRFTGKAVYHSINAVDNGIDFSTYIVGYVFSHKEQRCHLIGVVLDKDDFRKQDQADIDKVTAEVDAMMQTVKISES